MSTNFPTSVLLVNTKGKVRWSAKIAGTTIHETIPEDYGFVGLKLEGDPESSSSVCRAATGKVAWADISHGEPSAVFDGTSAWGFSIGSSSEACAEGERGKVKLKGVGLLFETLGASKAPIVATGTLVGKWEQPGAICPAGGIKLETKQSGITTEPTGESVEVDNGTTGEAAYLCVGSANNYVYPSEEGTWKLEKGVGLWGPPPPPPTCTFPYCERTITAGVRVAVPFTGETALCTAGPTMTNGTELFLLTAGHCMKKVSTGTETITQRVKSAYPSEVAGMTEKEIGKTVTFNNTASYDTAEVKIENAQWLLAGGGAAPYLAEWKAAPEAASILGTAPNNVGEETCVTGATSRLQCGKILRRGVTKAGTANLIETSVSSAEGDSGGPEFVPTTGGVLIQGTATTGGGSFAFAAPGDLTLNSDLVTELPEAAVACGKITEMKAMWTTGVPVSGQGIPANTMVTECKEEANGTATIKLSAAATETASNRITVGYTTLSAYEPMSQIEAVYAGQSLVEN